MLSSHVLDLALGRPARDLVLRLDVQDADADADADAADADRDSGWRTIASAITDGDGRVGDLLQGAPLAPRTYRITFETGAYFAAGGRPAFYPRVEVRFAVTAPDQHHHIPLLLAPFGYSTYRGT